MEILSNYINQILLMLILALAAWLGAQIKKLYSKYVTTEIKQAVCKSTVRYIEQVYKDLHGSEKLSAAMKRASEILSTYGITITAEELVTMLEAAVNEFNNAFNKAASDDKPAPELTG